MKIFLEIIISVAFADGRFDPGEQDKLESIARDLGYSQKQFNELIARLTGQANFIDQVSDKDLQNFLIKFSIDREKKIILYPARLAAWKGQINILEVAKKIAKNNLIFSDI